MDSKLNGSPIAPQPYYNWPYYNLTLISHRHLQFRTYFHMQKLRGSSLQFAGEESLYLSNKAANIDVLSIWKWNSLGMIIAIINSFIFLNACLCQFEQNTKGHLILQTPVYVCKSYSTLLIRWMSNLHNCVWLNSPKAILPFLLLLNFGHAYSIFAVKMVYRVIFTTCCHSNSRAHLPYVEIDIMYEE